MRLVYINVSPYSLLNDNGDLKYPEELTESSPSPKRSFFQALHSISSLLLRMHAFTKLMPLALGALADALPGQLQERTGSQFTDTVRIYR